MLHKNRNTLLTIKVTTIIIASGTDHDRYKIEILTQCIYKATTFMLCTFILIPSSSFSSSSSSSFPLLFLLLLLPMFCFKVKILNIVFWERSTQTTEIFKNHWLHLHRNVSLISAENLLIDTYHTIIYTFLIYNICIYHCIFPIYVFYI